MGPCLVGILRWRLSMLAISFSKVPGLCLSKGEEVDSGTHVICLLSNPARTKDPERKN